jgi:SNF2 family DNA or RNA helicase
VAKIIKKCPTCGKQAEIKSEMKLGNLHLKTYTCGHSATEMGLKQADEDTLNITSMDGKKPFNYQLTGARFIEESNGRVLIADEMALGKTVQFEMFVTAHPEARPFVVFTKARIKRQWYKESVRWGDMMVQVVDGTQEQLIPGFDGYIISYDSAWRIGMKSSREPIYPGSRKTELVYTPIEGKTLPEQLKKCKVKTVGLDECQLIKNADSSRAKAIQDVCRQDSIKYIIGLSGTPIKNNASEYFPILNILRPDKFPNKRQFLDNWCDSHWDGYKMKVGGLRNPSAFQNYTKDFIIRRTRAEVLPDLPSIFRQNSFSDLGEMVEEEYKKTLREFNEFYDAGPGSNAFLFQSNILAYLSKMRHLTGLSKIDPVCEFVESFIMETNRKLAVFTHHIDVANILKTKLENMSKEWPAEWGKVLTTVGVDVEKAGQVIEDWQNTSARVCILSTLASGEGLNLQFCSDCIIMERQWNPANEEQAEARFPRPGQTADKINAMYFVAVGTVDEFFSELVEKKRSYVASTLDGKQVAWDESNLVKELAQIIREKGGQRWGW